MRQLPPLNAVRAFEAAARHQSFTKAAAELGVTHGAISRQVTILEEWLGAPLFHRQHFSLSLTTPGTDFVTGLTPLLDRLESLSSAVMGGATALLRVESQPTLTMRWLITRLLTFQRKRRDAELRVTTSMSPIDFSTGRYDVAIRSYQPAPPNSVCVPFMNDLSIPVCHSDLAEDIRSNDVRSLERHTLISYATRPDGWREWLEAAGSPGLEPASVLTFDQMYYAVQAATEGLGVVIAPAFLMMDDLIVGRLAAPFGLLAARRLTYSAYFPRSSASSPLVVGFCEWLKEEGRATEEAFAAWAGAAGLAPDRLIAKALPPAG